MADESQIPQKIGHLSLENSDLRVGIWDFCHPWGTENFHTLSHVWVCICMCMYTHNPTALLHCCCQPQPPSWLLQCDVMQMLLEASLPNAKGPVQHLREIWKIINFLVDLWCERISPHFNRFSRVLPKKSIGHGWKCKIWFIFIKTSRNTPLMCLSKGQGFQEMWIQNCCLRLVNTSVLEVLIHSCNRYILNVEICFMFAILFIWVQGVDGGNLGTLGRTLFKPQLICLKIPTMIYLTHARMSVRPNLPFLSSFIGKRDMLGMASEEKCI